MSKFHTLKPNLKSYSTKSGCRQPIRSSNLFDAIYQPFNNHQSDPNTHMYINNTNNQYDPNQQLLDNAEDDAHLIHLLQQRLCTLTSDVDGNFYLEMSIDLVRQDSGFGFRIVGGEEEGSQVAVGYIVAGGAAHLDGRLRPNDEIVMIDDECVLGATHRRVVQLMTIAGLHRRVKLMVRRKLSLTQYKYLMSYQSQGFVTQTANGSQRQQQRINTPSSGGSGLSPSIKQQQQHIYPYTITLFRNGNEGFGFVIISTVNKNGPTIGNQINNKI
jgi:archaeosine-15-forming tRNA-guanine transglycosylase